MMQTNSLISDKKVFNQMFKALRASGFTAIQNTNWKNVLKVADGNENYVFYGHSDTESFNKQGYLTKSIELDWNGDGKALKQMAEDFGYEVVWDGGTHYKMEIKPVSKETLASR